MARSLLLALLLLAVAAVPAEAALKTFRSPSGKLGCMYVQDRGTSATVRCDWRGGARAVVVGESGKGRRIRISDTVLDPGAKVLPYGTTKRYGAFRCTSRRSGITCKNPGGHGFTVSVQRQKVF